MIAAASDASGAFVQHALTRDWQRLTPAAQHAARAFLFDTICVGIAGRTAVNADAVWHLACAWGGTGTCSVLGRPGAATSAPYAAFINAFQIHAQEFDCVHEGAVAHPMATVVAALLAEVERTGPYDGATFLAALVAGVDVVAALGIAATSPLRFFRPSTAGIFGCVAALTRLKRLDPAVARDAFGHALAFASGTMQAHLEGKPNLALQVAGAARSAIEAIDLAGAGIAAAACSIDGPFGYLALFEAVAESGPAIASLSSAERITELSWKPFPTGRAAHGAIVALRTMIQQGLTAATLDRFVYRAPPLIARLVGRRPLMEMDAPYARLCFPYLGAVTLLRGTVGLGDFGASSLANRDVHALAARITVESDGSADPAAFVPAIATANSTDGAVFSVPVEAQFGSPAWPLTRLQRFEKAQECLAFGGLAQSGDALAVIHDAFETVRDVRAALAPVFG